MSVKKITLLGILSACAIVLSVTEGLVFSWISIGIPGFRVGLANIAVLVAVKKLNIKCGAIVALLKAFASFAAAGSLTALVYALAGTALSFAVMTVMIKYMPRMFSLCGVSSAGGAVNNFVQLVVMVLMSSTPGLFAYLPVLTICGTGFGFITGFAASVIVSRTEAL